MIALNNVLAIESGVGAGSIALFSRTNNLELDREGASRAERIISVIAELLDEAQLTVSDLDLVAVSRGPGSYSGIRIGASTALGLARAAGIPCVGVSVLDALADAAKLSARFGVAIPVGKNDVAWQPFTGSEAGAPVAERDAELLSIPVFLDEFDWSSRTLFAATGLSQRLSGVAADANVVDAGSGLAEYVGRFAVARGRAGGPVEPIYLRNRDAIRPATF